MMFICCKHVLLMACMLPKLANTLENRLRQEKIASNAVGAQVTNDNARNFLVNSFTCHIHRQLVLVIVLLVASCDLCLGQGQWSPFWKWVQAWLSGAHLDCHNSFTDSRFDF